MTDKMKFSIKIDPGFVNGARLNTYVIFAIGAAFSNEFQDRAYLRIVICNAEIRIGWWGRDDT